MVLSGNAFKTLDGSGDSGKSFLFFLTKYLSTESVYPEMLIGTRQSG
jgi:hypothetical protein